MPAALPCESPAVEPALPAGRAGSAAAPEAAATAAAAILAGPRLVDRQVAAAELLAVELRDGRLALFARRHLDEAEAARAARVAILDDRGRLDVAGLREQVAEVFARSLERKVADVKFNGHSDVPLPLKGVSKRSFPLKFT